MRAGAARDNLLGLRCVTGLGQSIKTGGRVVKNVTGYDLCKLLTGSYGTLAVLTEVTFKVMPRAETEATLLLWGLPETDLLAILRRAVGSSHDVSAAACLPALAAGRSATDALHIGRTLAALRLEGPGPSVDYRLQRLEEELAAPGLEHGPARRGGQPHALARDPGRPPDPAGPAALAALDRPHRRGRARRLGRRVRARALLGLGRRACCGWRPRRPGATRPRPCATRWRAAAATRR